MSTTNGTGRQPATHARLLHAIANLIDEGLPTPFSIRPADGSIYFNRNEAAAVGRWAAAFGFDPPTPRMDHLYPRLGTEPAWREYHARGMFLGHRIDIWCSVDEPDEPLPDDEVDSDAEAPQPAPTELSTALPHRLPETWPAPGAAPPLDPDSPPYASAIAYRAEPRWTW